VPPLRASPAATLLSPMSPVGLRADLKAAGHRFADGPQRKSECETSDADMQLLQNTVRLSADLAGAQGVTWVSPVGSIAMGVRRTHA
jgi:propanediol utilization protein